MTTLYVIIAVMLVLSWLMSLALTYMAGQVAAMKAMAKNKERMLQFVKDAWKKYQGVRQDKFSQDKTEPEEGQEDAG